MHSEWNVQIVGNSPKYIIRAAFSAGMPTIPANRCRISPAALFVYVMATTSDGCTPRVLTKWWTRLMIVFVFPVPAPATIRQGPATFSIASRCLSLKFSDKAVAWSLDVDTNGRVNLRKETGICCTRKARVYSIPVNTTASRNRWLIAVWYQLCDYTVCVHCSSCMNQPIVKMHGERLHDKRLLDDLGKSKQLFFSSSTSTSCWYEVIDTASIASALHGKLEQCMLSLRFPTASGGECEMISRALGEIGRHSLKSFLYFRDLYINSIFKC